MIGYRVLKRTQRRFPADLERRENAILNAVNTETKQVVIGFCLDDRPKTADELRSDFAEIVQTWQPNKRTFESYSHKTFVPIGLVAEELVQHFGSPVPTLTWRINKAGKKYGMPIAAFSMKYAVDHEMSLHAILGSTLSRGKSRSPLNRVKILKHLVENKEVSEVDLAQKLVLGEEGVHQHLLKLKKIGFLDYESISCETSDWAKYKWIEEKNPDDVKTVGTRPSLTKKVAQYLHGHGESDRNEISKALNYSHPVDVSKILSDLEKQGFAECIKWKGGNKLSEIIILKPGIEFAIEYIIRIEDALADGPELANMQKVYEEFEANPDKFAEYVDKAVELYKRVSPVFNCKPREKTFKEIMEFARSYPDPKGPRARDIMRNIKYSSPSNYITPLFKAGYLLKEKNGKEVRYRINPEKQFNPDLI